ncbi:DUF4132 domain-containing protein [uncultured Bacteroides sp.]|uniref:DUF4132 domain-containing protein n=1 Tax=uncultured Bacteroides sp. TaxID=162156 RepID=UPI0025D9C0E7|nr:DUF4132 domain-containing protein [uncultured Bacteroides sp.]
MRLVYNNELNKRIKPYLENLLKKKTGLDKTTAALFDIFMEYFNMDSRYGAYNDSLEPCFILIIQEEKIKSVANLFDGKLNKMLRYMLGEEYANSFHTYLKLKARCPYTFGYARRSQRSVTPYLHLNQVVIALTQFLKLRATGFTTEAILNGGNTPQEIEAYKGSMDCESWMAARIAEGDEKVIDYLRNVLTSENNANRLQKGHLQTIAISGYQPLLELEGKLLLAAKLQEGLRQAVVETMDEGCPESFLHLFSVIYNNGLQRFASVKRGIAVSTGIGEQDSRERVTNKYLELIQLYLNDQEQAHKALQSKDTIELYLALWSIGFYNSDEIRTFVPKIINEGAKHQVQTLLYFLHCTQNFGMNHRISKDAFEVWHNEPSVVAAILPLYMAGLYLSRYSSNKDTPELNSYFDSKEEAIRQFEYLEEVYQTISAKETYSPFIFPWETAELTRSEIVQKMAFITWIANDSVLKDRFCPYLVSLDSYVRANYVGIVLDPPTSQLQEECVLQALGDRSAEVREEAYNVLADMTLTPEQYLKVEELLRFKYSEMRVNAINLLMKQSKEQLAGSIRRLLTDKVLERRLAGLDMMKTMHNDASLQDTYQALLPIVREIQKPNAKEKVLIESLIGDGKTENVTQSYTKENGFGLYSLSLEVTLPEITQDKGFSVRKAFEFICFGKAKLVFKKLSKYIEMYKNETYRNSYGETCMVGNGVLVNWSSSEGLSGLGLPEVWQAFYEKEIGSFDKLLMMSFMLASTGVPNEYDADDFYEEDEEDIKAARKSANSFEPLTNRMYNGIIYRGLQKELRQLPYYEQMDDIINALTYQHWDEMTYQRLSTNMLLQLLPLLNTENIFRQYTSKHAWLSDKMDYGEKQIVYPIHNNKFVQFWLQMPHKWMTDEMFTRYFTVRYQLYKLTNYMEHTPELEETDSYINATDFARAWLLGLIPTEEVYRELIGRINSPEQIRNITNALNESSRANKEKDASIGDIDFSLFRTLLNKVVDRILEIELKRGDSETQVTRLAEALSYVYGSETFIRILQAFGKDAFIRDSYNWGSTKRGVLSHLLHSCYPLSTDTSVQLKKLAKQAEIKDERLVEAAMFAPQWIELTEKTIGWKGLTSAAYYFHAHTNDSCDDKKKAIIARYTPIDMDDLREGAFDISWFKDAYKTIGKQRFEVVYNAAKYISCSNSHTRARKFADATNGVVKAEDVKKEIVAKRNKDLLMSYGLIPLGKKTDKELLERYQFLQQFLKDSKEFGAQRQENEKKAVNIALKNLALNSGYGDVTRLTWSMETELIKELLPYLTPKEIDDIEVYVEINEEGKADIKQIKAGKALNSMPAKLKKHPYVEELKEVHKKLKDQYTRSRTMLEQAMEDCISFEENELRKLMQNPVIWPLLRHLVFTCNGQLGFYTDGLLVTANAVCLPLKPKDKLRVAHPTDLYASNDWHAYQKYLFDNSIRQPFKQVFRELYVPTADEKDATLSRRYAGNQIQPRKTIAVLKGRRWVADYEDGLQKIYYKENIIATIYAMADWFSPADIESPTLEYVCFHNRKDYSLMKISEIPSVIFSEVMRDVDMAVSVAHAGSVDPETSHSTIEMRGVLVEMNMPLFHLDNVKVKGNFAHIEGKLGNYNIHLGSGVIHQEGGAQIAVLPVHSQSRGRLFLPFVDEDPKTAEILTKIIFFAEDDKIKDPSILNQIK